MFSRFLVAPARRAVTGQLHSIARRNYVCVEPPVVRPPGRPNFKLNNDGTYTFFSGKQSFQVDAATFAEACKQDHRIFGANVYKATPYETLKAQQREAHVLKKPFNLTYAAMFCAWWGWYHRPAAYQPKDIPTTWAYIAAERRGLYNLADAFDDDIAFRLYDPETFGRAPDHHPPYLPLYNLTNPKLEELIELEENDD